MKNFFLLSKKSKERSEKNKALSVIFPRGFNQEPELPRKVAAFWRHWPCVEGEELSTRLLCAVITEAKLY